MNPQDPQPTSSNEHDDKTLAANLIRQKLSNLYTMEPDAGEEAREAQGQITPRSKHQLFMLNLSNSGKSREEVQAAWHQYYAGLPDAEKHDVWQEFYAHSQTTTGPVQPNQVQPVIHAVSSPQPYFSEEQATSLMPTRPAKRPKQRTTRSVAEIKQQLLSKVQTRQKIKAKQHIQSLVFGLGVGSLVMLVMLFSFFNERFIAPFITPSKQVSSTPIIIDTNQTTTADPTPKVIIPKINVEIPVVYDEPSIEEKAVQDALERGVVHYATTPSPGQRGNVVVFGHSSNNIFNQGRYKFAFVLLSRLEVGDTFYLTKDGNRYAYRIYEKKIVKPTAVEVLGQTDKPDTATLITCDPPGTTLNRLVVIGEQISPDPNVNTASTATVSTEKPAVVPSNAPSLWERITSWL